MSQNTLDDTKLRILEAAGAIFADRGFKESTVRDICQAAGANLAAVNYHFGDKERLYIESVKLAHQLRVEQFPAPTWPAGTPAEQKLRDFIFATLCRMIGRNERGWEFRLMLREITQPTGACEELVRDYIRPHFELLQSILAELLPASTPDIQRRRIGFSIIGQCLHYRVAEPILRWLLPPAEFEQNTPEQLADHIACFTLAALGYGPPLVTASSDVAPPKFAAPENVA
ncbi:MAG: CerR family C-terminal domain-containing protein [Planctomycetaceae bacterium]|nr:CerR family C-terminal domain-containing protein [Planctomycetaceae bacterium]